MQFKEAQGISKKHACSVGKLQKENRTFLRGGVWD